MCTRALRMTMLLWPMLLIITPDKGGFGLNYHFYVRRRPERAQTDPSPLAPP